MMTINWLLDHGLRHATLTGGDPMTSSNFWAVCEKLSLEGVIFQVFTTGLFINSSNVTRFLEYPINFVQISLDSMEPNYHDRYRGKSHKQVVEAVKILSGNGIKTVIGSNIFSDTVEHIEYLAEFAASTNSVLRCNPIDARGRGFGFSSDNAYNGNLRERIEFFSDRLKDRFPQVFMEDVDVGDLGDELHCKFYHGMIAIGSDGRIRPCLESKSFFKKVAPWAIENRKAYDLNSIEDHCAYSIIKRKGVKSALDSCCFIS
jgi:MoaA/NifB/PqqE/SkfB family radical SAM enzyme